MLAGLKREVMPNQDQIQTVDRSLEYSTCVDFCKYSGGAQFAQLSVFFVLMSGLLYFTFGEKTPNEPLLTYFKAGGAVLAFCLWVVEESHAYLASNFFHRAQDLEEELGFKAFSQLPKRLPYWYGPTNWAFRVVYGGFFLFWVTTALRS